jgi:hypothetical protein
VRRKVGSRHRPIEVLVRLPQLVGHVRLLFRRPA